MLIISFLLVPVHLIIFHFSLLNCSGVLKMSQRFVFTLCFHSNSFEDVIFFKPFNSTGAFSLKSFQRCIFWVGPNPQVFFQDLTWLFQFSRSSLKFISKFDVRMIYHQSNVFSKIYQILFIIGSTFSIFILECINDSWWCFSSSLSTFEDRRRVFPPYLIRSLRDSWL